MVQMKNSWSEKISFWICVASLLSLVFTSGVIIMHQTSIGSNIHLFHDCVTDASQRELHTDAQDQVQVQKQQLLLEEIPLRYQVPSISKASIPKDIMSVVAEFAVDSTKLIKRNTKEYSEMETGHKFLDLSQKLDHSKSLNGYDFSGIFSINLSDNSLIEVNEQHATFDNVCNVINLSKNRISSIHLENTSIQNVNLKHNQLTNINDVRRGLPPNLYNLELDGNKFEALKDHKFSRISRLSLAQCGITKLKDITFDATDVEWSRTSVSLNNNPIESMKNVRMVNCHNLYMQQCDMSLEKLIQFDISFEGLRQTRFWDLKYNLKLTKRLLQESYFRLPDGVMEIRVNGGVYTRADYIEKNCDCVLMR